MALRLPFVPLCMDLWRYREFKVGTDVDKDYSDIKSELQRFNLPQFVQVPTKKLKVSVHGGVSCGKSSFINDLMGISVQTTYEDEQDTSVTIIFTASEEKFKELKNKRVQRYDSKVAQELSFDDLKSNMHHDVRADVKSRSGAVLLLEGQAAINEALSLGFDWSQAKISSSAVRAIVINEKIYDLPSVTPRLFETAPTPHGEGSWPSVQDRITLAKTLCLVDTPGIKEDDAAKEKALVLDVILRSVSHSFFITGGICAVDVHPVEVFGTALKSLFSPESLTDAAIWNNVSILVGKVDDFDGLVAAQKKFSKTLSGKAPVPVDQMFRSIGLPSGQRERDTPIHKRNAADLPLVYNSLIGKLNHAQTTDAQKKECITAMAQKLLDHLIASEGFVDSCKKTLENYYWVDLTTGTIKCCIPAEAYAKQLLDFYRKEGAASNPHVLAKREAPTTQAANSPEFKGEIASSPNTPSP